MDSRVSRSRFEPRIKSSEIKVSLQAFRFALGKEVIFFFFFFFPPDEMMNWLIFFFCFFVAKHSTGVYPLQTFGLGPHGSWQHQKGLPLCQRPRVRNVELVVQNSQMHLEVIDVASSRWELLDNPAYSNLCDCCDSSCKSRKTRSIGSGSWKCILK